MKHLHCNIGRVQIGRGVPALIAGPCMAESYDLCLEVAQSLQETCQSLGIGYIFKASYDKANRSSVAGYRGPGLKKGLQWLAEIREKLNVPVLTDIHEISHAAPAAEVVDCLQIPAFLCRQTDLIVAAAQTNKPVNIKKGQFMAPWDMNQAVQKVRSSGNDQVLLTERGTFFGYNRLVTDLRSIPQMQEYAPVVFDATHSVQEPAGLGSATGGQRQFAPMLCKAAIVAGADALFIETHPDPEHAKSDAAVQLPLIAMHDLLKSCLAIYRATQA